MSALEGLSEFQKNTLVILHEVQRTTGKPTRLSGKLRLQAWSMTKRGLVSTDASCGHGHYALTEAGLDAVREHAKRCPTLLPHGVAANLAALGGAS